MPARRATRALLAAVAVVALAGCGDAGDDAPTPAPTLSATTLAAPPVSTAAPAATTATAPATTAETLPVATTAEPAATTAEPAATTAETGTTAATGGTDALPVGAPLELVQPGMSADAGPVGPSTISCETVEHLDHHWHTSLAIVLDGTVRVIPAEIGIRLDASPPCLYWVHTHVNAGIVHIEAPVPREYSLADFFAVWGAPLGPEVLVDHAGPVYAWIDGAPFTGDPSTIVLRDGQSIVLSDEELEPSQLPQPDFSEVQ